MRSENFVMIPVRPSQSGVVPLIFTKSPTFIDYLKICYALPSRQAVVTQHLDPVEIALPSLRHKKDLVETSGGRMS
mgnify:FL=1